MLRKDAYGDYYSVYPERVVRAIREAIETALMHDSFLCKTCAEMCPPRMLWNMTQKLHDMWHIGEQAEFSSLRVMWTYNNEDFMGKVQSLGEANRHGLIAARRSVGIAQNYVMGRSLEMHFRMLGPLLQVRP